MARWRSDRGRTAPAAVLAVCAALFAATPAQAAPAVYQKSVTVGNGMTFIGRGQGGALPNSPLIRATAAVAGGADPEQARQCVAGTLSTAAVSGKIVLCDVGLVSAAEKVQAVLNAGGVGVVLANVDPGPLISDALSLPTVHIDHNAGAAVRAYIDGTANPSASMSAATRIFAASTTSLVSSANPSTVGKPVTLTATVGAGSLNPEGSVAFIALGVLIPGCTTVAVVTGKARCTVAPFTAGAYGIQAVYSGDDGLDASSGTLTQRVVAPPAVVPQTPPVVAPAISDLQLGARCVRRAKSGRVRVPMAMQLAKASALQVVVERAVGSKARRRCPAQSPPTNLQARFRPAATVPVAAARAAAVSRRLTLRLRLKPGLYRVTVRAVLDDESLSRPVRGFVRVLR
jgi:Big-like domain-containing protein/PA domain-containing protein